MGEAYDVRACRRAQVSLSILRASSSYRWTPSGLCFCSSSSLMRVSARTGQSAARRTLESIYPATSARSRSRGGGGCRGRPWWLGRPKGLARTPRRGTVTWLWWRGYDGGRAGRKGRRGTDREAAHATKDKASVRAPPRRVGGETRVLSRTPHDVTSDHTVRAVASIRLFHAWRR